MNEICIDNSRCKVCCECINICTQEVLGLLGGAVKVVRMEQCTYCEECVDICPEGLIEVKYDLQA